MSQKEAHATKSLYDAQTPLDALLHLITVRNSKRRVPISVNQLSSKLGYRSPRALGMVLKGQRQLSQAMLWSVAKEFNLKQRETRFLELLSARARLTAKSLDAGKTDAEIQSLIVREEPELSLDTRSISYIANWYHFVLKQVVESPNFKNSEAWILKRLRGKVSAAQVTSAFQNMFALGLLLKDKSRGWKVREGANIRGSEDIPSEAIRQHHAQMMQRAMEALSEQNVNEREMLAWTLRLDPKRLPEVKNYLREMGREFNAKFSEPHSSNVFQLNVQFFQHTPPDSESV
jgi:uncharacterized protein (TIGR02147 family)